MHKVRWYALFQKEKEICGLCATLGLERQMRAIDLKAYVAAESNNKNGNT